MQVSYGPPGRTGVTKLMAVGADELELGVTDRAVKVAGGISIAVLAFGVLTKSRSARALGLGATLALLGVSLASGALAGSRVQVATAPAK